MASGTIFGSIPVKELHSLIEDIKADYNIWIDKTNDSCERPSAWTGLSGDVQKFFKALNIKPFEKYKNRYSPQRHTIATSYVWSKTTLFNVAGEFAKPEYKGGRVFIDILLVPQQDVASEQVVGTTSEAYSDCWVVAFVDGDYLRRAWCCCELAVATKHHCKITVVGTCDQVVGRDFFGKMVATVPKDVELIKAEIIKKHGTAQAFNHTVASAMEVLFVAAAKSKHCAVFQGVGPRHERSAWITRLQSTNPQEQQRDKQRDWEVLIGNMSHASASSNRTLTVCLVSTLTDTILEWSFFHQDCVPYLEKCALKRGLDLVVSDMRCGNRDEDSVKAEVVLAEFQRCKAESAAVCFLIISGDKYGHRPIPSRIPKADFDNLITKMRADDADRVKGYYLLDENQLNQERCPAPEYVLQAADKVVDRFAFLSSTLRAAAEQLWPHEELRNPKRKHAIKSFFTSLTKMRAEDAHRVKADKAVDRYAFLSSTSRAAAEQLWPRKELRNPKSKHAIKSFFTSQVEMELFQGIFCDPIEAQDVNLYLRSFQPESLHFDTSPVIGIYTNKQDDQEATELLRDLQGTMLPGVLNPECITRYEIAFQEGIDPDSVDLHRTYLCNFLDHSCNVVLRSLDQLEQKLAMKPSPLVDEISLHLNFAQVRGQRFCSTASSSAALAKVRSYLSGKGGRTFVLWAPSGAGKTYVMAKAAEEGKSGDAPQGTVVMRFLGTSSKSSDAMSMLQSVCEQLQTLSMGEWSFTEDEQGQRLGLDPCPTSYEKLCKYFKAALKRWSWGPLSIFLDSVDQLDDTNSGRNLAWLPLEGYSDQVHLVVSTLPDEINPEVGRPFRCLSTLRKGLKEGNFVHVEALQDAQELLRHLLRLKGRCATRDQIHVLVNALRNAENKAQTPLMATLMAHLASGWNSFTKAPDSLPSSVRDIILEFFKILEGKRGETFVSHALSLITLAKQGLSVSELQELLSLDDDALADSYQWWVTPQLKMPSAPLLLLLADVDPFLSRRGALIFWYHRQLWEAVEAIYLKEPEARASFHRILAEFFSGRWSEDKAKPCNENLLIRLGQNRASSRECRHVRDQPYHWKGASALHPGAEYNNRRCVEALYQMVKELEVRKQASEKSGHVHWSDELCECLKMAAEEVCSVEGVCARSIVGEGFNLVSQCAKVAELSSLEGSPLVDASIIKHYQKWIMRDSHEFKSPGQVVASLLRQPDASEVRRLYLASKLSIPGIPTAVFGNSSDFDAVISILKGHALSVTSVSCEGNQIASASSDNTVIIWDAKTGELVSTLKGHTAGVQTVAWRPGGDQIVSGGYGPGSSIYAYKNPGEIIIWDAKTGEKVSTLKGHTKGITSVAWRPGGDQIVSGAGNQFSLGEVIIWDAKTGDKISELKGHTKGVTSVAWRPGGDQIASGSRDETIIIWDAKTGEQVSTLKGHTNSVTSVAWRPGSPGHPGGDQIVSGGGYDYGRGEVIIWDAKTGDKISVLKGHTRGVNSVAWRPGSDRDQIADEPGHWLMPFLSRNGAPGGDLIVSGGAGEVIIWDAKTGEKLSELEGHVTSVAWFSGSDQIACGSSEHTIIIWDAKTAKTGGQVSTLMHTLALMSVAWRPGGDAKTAKQVSTLKGHTKGVQCVSWRPGSDQIASASVDETIIIWDAKTGEQVMTLKGSSGSVSSVAWRPGGDQIASASEEGTIIIWDAKIGEQISTLEGHTNAVTSVAWRPEGDQIASASLDRTIIIWDAKTGEQVSTLKGHTDFVTSVAWRPGGDQIAGGSGNLVLGNEVLQGPTPDGGHGNAIIVWDAKTGEQVSTLKGQSGGVSSVAWRPWGDQIASASEDNTIIIWDAKTGEQVSTLEGHTEAVRSVAWRPGGDQIASASDDKTIIIWDAKTGAQVSTLKGHTSYVTSVAWRPGGDQIASGSDDKTIIIWDAKNGEQVSTFKGHTKWVTSSALRPGDDQIVSGGLPHGGDCEIMMSDSNTISNGGQESYSGGLVGEVVSEAEHFFGGLVSDTEGWLRGLLSEAEGCWKAGVRS